MVNRLVETKGFHTVGTAGKRGRGMLDLYMDTHD